MLEQVAHILLLAYWVQLVYMSLETNTLWEYFEIFQNIYNQGFSMMYAMVYTRLDLAHAVSVVSKYMANLGRHSDAVKQIFRYLKCTTKYDITLVRQKNDLLVIKYADVDYTRNLDHKRLTIDYVFTIAGGPICWRSMIQSTVAMSTIEAEYMVVAEAANEALCLMW